MENVDTLPNLELLEGIPNQEKSDTDFDKWLTNSCGSKRAREDYMKKHFIPNVALQISNFKDFIKNRKAAIKSELIRLLIV